MYSCNITDVFHILVPLDAQAQAQAIPSWLNPGPTRTGSKNVRPSLNLKSRHHTIYSFRALSIPAFYVIYIIRAGKVVGYLFVFLFVSIQEHSTK